MPAVHTEPRRRMRASDRREQILDIAHAIVDAEGFHAATINRIAAEAGVTRTVIYQQFGDLSSLFIALLDREADRARRRGRRGRLRGELRRRPARRGRTPRHLAAVPRTTAGRAARAARASRRG